MNILVVCNYGSYQDFGSSFVHAQAAAYAALGHRVRVILPCAIGKRDWDGSRFSGPVLRRDQDGVEVCLMRHLSISNYGRKGFNLASALRTLSREADKLLEGFTPDIIHAHMVGFDSEIGAWLKERLGVPLVVTTHIDIISEEPWMSDPARIVPFADQADHLVCVSSFLKRQMEGCGVSAPMSVILNGFHVKNIAPGTDKPPFSLIQAGRLVSYKKADVTIRAFAKLREKYPSASLSIVGSGGELKRFQALCQDLGVADAVQFHGFLANPEAMAEMARARFFVLPSVNEGFGIVYLEAMASGCVTIGTEGGGIADLIVSGENGFLAPPDDPDAIVQVIEWCLGHPDEAAAIAERGRKDALDLTWEKNAAEYIQLFKSLTEGKQGQ